MQGQKTTRSRIITESAFWLFLVLVIIVSSLVLQYSTAMKPSVRKAMQQAERHLASGKVALAEKELRRAIDMDRGNPDVYAAAIGVSSSAVKRVGIRANELSTDLAAELLDLSDSGKLARKLTDDELVGLLVIHSSHCFNLGRKDEAFSALERTLKLRPGDPRLSNDLGYLYADSDRQLDRALQLIEMAVEADPDNPMYIDSLGWVYYKLGRYEQAVQELKSAVTLSPGQAEIRYHLGAAFAKTGRKTEAVLELEKALALAPTMIEARSLLTALTAPPKHSRHNL